jgi:hypothetical protein
MAKDQLAERAEEIVDTWVESNVEQDDRIGSDQFLVRRSELVHLVFSTMEIVLRRVSQGLFNRTEKE